MTQPQQPNPFLVNQLRDETDAKALVTKAVETDVAGAPRGILDAIRDRLADLGPELVAVSHDLAEHPETGFEEHRSAAGLAEFVEAHGIEVARGAYGLPTALYASAGGAKEGPTIAVLSEYDALPGIGHGCGHNLIATVGVGAFLAIASVIDRLGGRAIWLGTPAEEGGGGKELMAQQGAFDGVDAAIMVHPFTYDTSEPVFLGRRQLKVTYVGVPAHASIQPFMGRNALDAANLLYTGVALNRQQMPPTDRVHAIITDGGLRPNVIPEHASIEFYVRSAYPETLKILSQRLEEMAMGAALMTGCGVEFSWDGSPVYLPIRNNSALAQAWNRRYQERNHTVLAPGVVPDLLAGSTDFGNVSFRVPGLHAMVKIAEPDVSLHSREFAAAAVTPYADEVLVDAAYGLAGVAADYLCDAHLRERVCEEFEEAGGAVDVTEFFG
jgi:amidohydrolase